jgi:hypothetical protein
MRVQTLRDVTHRNGRTDEEGKNECYAPHVSLPRTTTTRTARTSHIVARSPGFHIEGIENSQKRKAPGNSIDYDLLSFRGKLVDDGTQEE